MSDSHLLRMLDAAANRASEGLRVVEDFTRFVMDDRHLTEQIKVLRHDLAEALSSVDLTARCAARETQRDVGTTITTAAEQQRGDLADLWQANIARSQQALRSLEESAKLWDVELAARLESLRYRSYTLAAALATTREGIRRLADVRLYALVDGCPSLTEFQQFVGRLVSAHVGAVQLRDKRLGDRALLDRARCLREMTRGKATLFIVNDRPDIACLAGADGIHVGQEELSVKDVRSIVGVDSLIGVSTHSLAQARQAVLDGANYIGVGPTFPSPTKEFESHTGTDLLKAVAEEVRIPAFAIGGIGLENIADVVATGIGRIAVSSALRLDGEPADVARRLMQALDPVTDASVAENTDSAAR